MKVFVAGGTGFIGSHLVDRLANLGLNVIVPARKSSSSKYLSGSVQIREADLLETESVNEILKGVDVVFHLAAIRGSGWSFDDKEVYKINVGITKNLLRASVAESVKHFLYVSSVSIYGHPCSGPIGEEHPANPVTRYGETKYESERLVHEFHTNEQLPVTVIRPVITYGPRDTWGMIPKLISLINSKRYLTIGKGENRVHLIYIDDLIDGLLLVMKNRAAVKETYNMAGAEPVTINRLVNIILSSLDKKGPVFHVPTWLGWGAGYSMEVLYRLLSIGAEPFITRDKVDIMCRDRCFNILKAEENLGLAPMIGHKEGIKKTIDWLKAVELV
jgi:dTDP-glucose 4,6-dehydratase